LRSESIKTNYDESRPINSDLPIIIQNGQITSVAFKANWDTRDFRLDPAMGQLVSFTYEPGYSKMSGSDGNTFTKLEMDLRKYLSPEGPRVLINDKRRTFAFRLQGGWSIGSLPFYEQFFLGGAERLRGYREDRFWGSKFLLGSAEYRTPIAGGLNGVLFADYGSAWGDDYRGVSERLTQSRSFDGHLGYGAGIRVSTPIGNLRFDYGFGDEGNRTHFSIGQAF
jgi:outer membrane protein insertion porin family